MANTTNFGWETPDDTDLVKDGAAAMRTLGNSIDSSFVDLKGGTTGQVLSKASNSDLDFSWIAVDPLTILDAKGDLISATAADTPARLAVGTNGQVLTADSTTSTGLKWATPAAGGKLLKSAFARTDSTFTRTTTGTTDALTLSFTPTSATSTILVQVSAYVSAYRANPGTYGSIGLYDGAAASTSYIYRFGWENFSVSAGNGVIYFPGGGFDYFSAVNTNARDYKVQLGWEQTGTVEISGINLTVLEIGA